MNDTLHSNYVRDKRSPKPKSETVSKVMRANRPENTKPEIALRKKLWQNGLSGYRLHYKKAAGKPDIAYVSKKIAIFVHGCFWHRCPDCDLPMPKTNIDFWEQKFRKNKERDERKIKELKTAGWKVFIIWECQLKQQSEKLIRQLKKY